MDGYRRTYQDFLYSFRIVEKLYKDDGRRRLPESVIPLRIEIDSFFSYVREEFTSGDSYLESEKLSGELLENRVREKIRSWHQTEWAYLHEKIPENYARIIEVLGSEERLKSSSFEEIVDALTVCHAFHEQLRFFKGGLPTVRKAFMADNSEARVKAALSHLLFGSGNFVTRMGECIFDPNFSLHHFGRSCVQELYGWINAEAPVCYGNSTQISRIRCYRILVVRLARNLRSLDSCSSNGKVDEPDTRHNRIAHPRW